eukprot:8678778-Pyramimonas_sp.AAC.1
MVLSNRCLRERRRTTSLAEPIAQNNCKNNNNKTSKAAGVDRKSAPLGCEFALCGSEFTCASRSSTGSRLRVPATASLATHWPQREKRRSGVLPTNATPLGICEGRANKLLHMRSSIDCA